MAVLGELEHRVMDVLWASQEEQSVRDVHTQLLADARIAYTTVMTVLGRLAKKHVVVRQQHQRAWWYRPASSKAQFLAGEMAQVLGEAGAARSDTLVELVRLLIESDRRVLRHVLAARAEVAGEPPRSRHGKRTIMPPGARSR